MKTIDQYRKSCLTFILIDVVLLIPSIIVATLFPSLLLGVSILANPFTLPLVLGFLLLFDLVILRWLIHISVEIDDIRRERSMKGLRTVYDAQKLLHILVVAAIAGIVAGKLSLLIQK